MTTTAPATGTKAERFSVVALIAAYNEADIIGQVVTDLLSQDVQVYLIDDGSTDGTAEIVEPYVGRGVIGVERTDAAEHDGFHWERLLRRKESLAHELDADWFIHHDADELRESPWPHSPLARAVEQVDALGFNAIDFEVLDFRPIDNSFSAGDDLRRAFDYYEPPAPYDRLQIRAWKKTAATVDLVSSGGHEARFPGRDVFPIRFVLRHYPVRSEAHGRRKIVEERRNRFIESERAKGWHVQYDDYDENIGVVRAPESLVAYDEAAIRRSLPVRERSQPELEALVAGLRSANESTRTDLRRREAELAERSATLAAACQELRLRSNELTSLREELAERTDALAARDAELAERDVQLAERDAELTRRQAEAAALTRDIQVTRIEVDALNRRLDAQVDETETFRTAAESFAREIDAFRHSLSWRFMAPARAILKLLRGW